MDGTEVAVFSVEGLSATELLDISLSIPEQPVRFHQDEIEPGAHGCVAALIPVFLFSFASLVSCLVWLDRQKGRVKLDLTVGIGAAKTRLTITREEARETLRRAAGAKVHSLQEGDI